MKKNILILILLTGLFFGCKSNDETIDSAPLVTLENKTIPVGKGPDAMYLTPNKEFIYIANVEDTTISIIETNNNNIVKTIGGIRNPWGFSQLGNSGNVALSGYDGQVVIISNSSQSIVKEKEFPTHLGGIASSSNGSFIYVISIDEQLVMKLDANSLDSLESYSTGQGPDGIGISADNNKLYVTNTTDGNISVINMVSGETNFLETDGKPELVHYNKDHSLLYISNFNNNVIHIINTGTDAIIHEITGLTGPEEAVLSEDETELFVVNFSLNKVFRYDAKTYEKMEYEYETGTNPIGVIPFDNKIYVTNYADNSVSLIYLND